MADDEGKRPKTRRGRATARQALIVEPSGNWDDNPGDDGSAGVREPRRPLPKGPVSGAGVRPEPEAGLVALLPDPRH